MTQNYKGVGYLPLDVVPPRIFPSYGYYYLNVNSWLTLFPNIDHDPGYH